MSATERHDDVTGLVLAGGRGTRMGGQDKGLITLGSRPMVAYVLAALAPQVHAVLVNANRNIARYEALGFRVVPDAAGGYMGPLAGMLSGVRAAATPFVVTVPCDSPLIGPTLVHRLYARLRETDAEICVAHDGERIQPVFCALRVELAPSLEAFLSAGERKIDRWFQRHRTVEADFSDVAQTLRNVNREADRAAVEARITGRGRASRLRPFSGIDIPVVGFAAASGTGKTTLLKAIIAELDRRDLRAGVIKHAHHDFDTDRPGKDSYELRKAGARQMLVSSRRRSALITELAGDPEPGLRELLGRLSLDGLDIVLIEGFKHEALPKIALHRASVPADGALLSDPDVIAVASDAPDGLAGMRAPRRPVLDLNRPVEIVEFILKTFRATARQTPAGAPGGKSRDPARAGSAPETIFR